MTWIQATILAVLLSASALESTKAADKTVWKDSVEAVTETGGDALFVGVDALETRLMVTAVLVFVLAILTVLLSLKIKRLDTRNRIK